ncbi:unnamed protein product [Brachionus calyciflorus]|uniref:Ricin B lectin domain-containing protein n=1 Tax=Brachionus calyciflorus TaxID=104777 RepID=A0A813RSU1_9BILA|nr:unnamed protein product [Brachionus calyciflorus]
MKKIIYLIVLINVSVLNVSCREYLTVLSSRRLTDWGDWHEPVFCPGESFAVGLDIKFQSLQYLSDDTHLNAIRFTCDDTASTKIMSGEGPFGKWYTERTSRKRSLEARNNTNTARLSFSLTRYLPKILKALQKIAQTYLFFTKEQLANGCDDMGKFAGFRFVAEPKISGDDTAGNAFGIYCESEDILWYSVDYFGKNVEATERYCPEGQAICGIRTQIEPKIDGDNTALNNVDIYCCKNYYKLFNVATLRALDSNSNGKVYTSERNDSPNQRWELIKHDEKFFSLKNRQTGLFLDSSTVGNVYARSSTNGDHQKWFKDGRQRIVNKATNRALDSNFAGDAYAFEPNDSDHQLWFSR